MAGVLGSATPRLCTPPLVPLTRESSRGFAFVDWCERYGFTLLPWQRTVSIAAMELSDDGSYRFRTVLILVGRQSGKTTLLKLWALWRMLEDDADLVVGAAQALDIAREAWQGSVDFCMDQLPDVIGKVRYANGEQCLTLVDGSRYRIVATTRSAGRGLSVDFLILDEVREQRDWGAWSSLSKTVIARPKGQIVAISNAGDDESVVLNSLRDAALGGRDPSVGLFEWSAPDGCSLDDPEMWAMGVPALGHTLPEGAVRTARATDPPGVFRTEILCQHVSALDTALEPLGWAHGADPNGTVGVHRDSLYAALDVSPAGHVVCVVAASVGEGRARVEPVAEWSSTSAARDELPAFLEQLRPLKLVWFPGGPSNSLASLLKSFKRSHEMTGQEVNQACQGFAEMVQAGRVLHNAQPLLDGQVATAGKQHVGDGYRFTRKGQGSCNALYAAAGAVHLAMTDASVGRAPVFVI